MTTKRAIMTLIGVSLLVAAALAGPADTKLGRCLPKSGDVSGWQAVSSSYKYGSGNGIADIYNGGYEKLLQKGMKAACTQNYSNDSRRINVYGNEFDTAANAKAYYNSETSGSGWSAVSGASEGAKYKKTSSVVVGHVYRVRCMLGRRPGHIRCPGRRGPGLSAQAFGEDWQGVLAPVPGSRERAGSWDPARCVYI